MHWYVLVVDKNIGQWAYLELSPEWRAKLFPA